MPYKDKQRARDARKARDKRFYDAHKAERKKATVVSRKKTRSRLHVYGITAEQWDAAFESQGRACACCGATEPRSKTGWHTDHDHETKQFRGILCHHCNTALGLVKDSLTVLDKMKIYLTRFVEQRTPSQGTT